MFVGFCGDVGGGVVGGVGGGYLRKYRSHIALVFSRKVFFRLCEVWRGWGCDDSTSLPLGASIADLCAIPDLEFRDVVAAELVLVV